MYKHCPYLALQKHKNELEDIQASYGRFNTTTPSENILSTSENVQVSSKNAAEEDHHPLKSSVECPSTKLRDVFSKTIEISSTTIVSGSGDDISKLHEELSKINEITSTKFSSSNPNSPKRRYFTKISSDSNFSKSPPSCSKVKSKHGLLDPIRRWNSFHSRDKKNQQRFEHFAALNLQEKLTNARDSLVSVVTVNNKVEMKSDTTARNKTRCKSESSDTENVQKVSRKSRCKSASTYPSTVAEDKRGAPARTFKSWNASEENLLKTEPLRERTYSDNCILSTKKLPEIIFEKIGFGDNKSVKRFSKKISSSNASSIEDSRSSTEKINSEAAAKSPSSTGGKSSASSGVKPRAKSLKGDSNKRKTIGVFVEYDQKRADFLVGERNDESEVTSSSPAHHHHHHYDECQITASPSSLTLTAATSLKRIDSDTNNLMSLPINLNGTCNEIEDTSKYCSRKTFQLNDDRKTEKDQNIKTACISRPNKQDDLVNNYSVNEKINATTDNTIIKLFKEVEDGCLSAPLSPFDDKTPTNEIRPSEFSSSSSTTTITTLHCDNSRVTDMINFIDRNMIFKETDQQFDNSIFSLINSKLQTDKTLNNSEKLVVDNTSSSSTIGSDELDKCNFSSSLCDKISSSVNTNSENMLVKLSNESMNTSDDSLLSKPVKKCEFFEHQPKPVSESKFEKLSLKFASKGASGGGGGFNKNSNRRDYLDSFINEKPQVDLYGNKTATFGVAPRVIPERTMSLNRSDPCLHSPVSDESPPVARPRRHQHRRPPAAPLPRRRFSVCFGKRTGGSARRPNECFVLEPSEMIVIDYPDTEANRGGRPLVPNLMDHSHSQHQHRPVNLMFDDPFNGGGGGGGGRSTSLYQKCSRGSHSSDTSSAYSGSDTMASTHSELGDPLEEPDLTGLVESIVDSDEDDDLAESMDSLTVRDTVRECLEKDPSERTEEDIETLLEFTQHLKAFTNTTLAIRRALCQVMVFAVVEKAGTIVMNDGEELDSWSVLVNGSVEVTVSGEPPRQLNVGDYFGILPTMDTLYHRGIMKTKCDDCQFVCITQQDYYRILHQGEENTKRHEEDGKLVLVTELRGTIESGARRGHVVIRGTPDRLMQQLIEENSLTDPTYVEDFLLTHRTFISSPLHVAGKLLEWFENPAVRDRVTRVVLLWVNNHFTDFETDPNMIEFLETFEQHLENEKMTGQLRLLNIACHAKARIRNVVLARPSRDEVLNFQILGGFERNFGIFISKVDKKSKAEEVGLKRGDQILEVNGQSFEHVSHARALEILRGTTHLSITVKSNLLHFKEMLNTPDNSPRPKSRKISEISRLQPDPRARLSSVDAAGIIIPGSNVDSPCSRPVALHSPHKESKSSAKSFMTLGPKRRLQKALMKMNILPKNMINSSTDTLQDTLNSTPPPGVLYQSQSNPDLMSLCYDDIRCTDYPEHVLKVYKPDQSCKYLLVHKETTAHEVVMLALQEFGMTEPSSNYSLCEVSVSDGHAIKQRRLPDQLQNLAERIGLSSRYYLKTNGVTETLVPDELAAELVRESAVHFLQLNAVEVAIQLTLQDFSIFRQIESTEYIDDLFELQSRYGTPMLTQFAELVNREMFWVVTEVCSEPHVVRRSKIIKQFIKVARQCKECKNFNSMFAIVSGLGHGAVSRLRQSWERLPGKYQRVFHDLQQLMDPSRNMSKYRQLVSAEQTQPPIIPFYPVVKKDLTFIHLGNDSRVDSLVNFEKLRMIAKEVRTLTNMCSSPYDLLTMLELGGQPPSSAMVALNQLTTAAGATHHSGQATVKRRKKSNAAPNPKKMFEESQMVRRVKAYLNNMKVINDETKLHALSLECEGNSGGHGGSSSGGSGQPARRRHASPAPSTTSSTSTASDERKPSGTKFGAASPQAVRKLLSLSEPGKTRPHQPPRPPSGSVGAVGSGLAGLPPGLLPPGLVPQLTQPGRRPPSATGSYSGYTHAPGAGGRAMHERSHSDTPTPLPSVALSAESSSVTSLSNLPLRKTHTSGSVASTDSGHSTGTDTHSNSSAETSVVSSVGHVTPATGPAVPMHLTHSVVSQYVPPASVGGMLYAPAGAVAVLPPLPHAFRLGANRRQLPSYSVAAQMARSHRLGRAHSHEGCHYHTDPDTDQDDEDTRVSAV